VDPRPPGAWIRGQHDRRGRLRGVAFYRWCVRQQRFRRNPVEAIRRPRRPTESTAASLTRHELTDWLAAAERRGGSWWAAAMLLAMNGLRCGELIACDVTDVGSHSWHHTLALRTTKATTPPSSRWRRRQCKPSPLPSDSARLGRCCSTIGGGG
jgi:integrase